MATGGDDDVEVMMATESTPAAESESDAPAAEAREQEDEVPELEEAAPASEGETAEDAAESDADMSESDDSTEAAEEESDSMTYVVPGDEADTSDDDEAIGLKMEQEAISDESTSEAQSTPDSGQTRWRIAQVSLALILVVLLTVMVGLPRQRGRRP